MLDSKQKTDLCPLCSSQGKLFYEDENRVYYQCANCSGIFMDQRFWLNLNEEKERYEQHNNDVNDKHFQHFVSPITSAVLSDFNTQHQGLDFGGGTGPVISKVLRDKEYKIEVYDPFFHNYPNLLTNNYDYIVCCEVMEHLHDPLKEFKRLKSMLNPKGKLYCMTHMYDFSIAFENWYYKNDLTHVFIYQRNTVQWIKDNLGFKDISVEGRLIVFSA